MNARYKILWIDDSYDFTSVTQELIEDTVKQNLMLPQINIYNTYDEFKEAELNKFDIDVFNIYDQIVIDYALSGMTGDDIIRNLRSRKVYTDIVFYSSNYETMKEDLKKNDQLDGVFFTDRVNLTDTIDKVIKKNLKREYSISNIRGLIMENTSEFDYICRTTTLALFEKLSADKQKIVVENARAFVRNAEDISQNSFKKLQGLDGSKFLKRTMESVEYVISNRDRYAIMSLVVREFEQPNVFNDSFAEDYKNKLITPRNDLAHNKLFYGACQKKLHIARKRQKLECDKNCKECKSKYSIDECEELRKIMYEYFILLNDIHEKANELVPFE